MGFERYVDYALDVPMYFVYRDGRYIDVAGASFRDFLAGKLAALPGERPTLRRLGRPSHHAVPRCAAEALPGDARRRCGLVRRRSRRCRRCGPGCSTTQAALDAALALTRDWTVDELQGLRDAVPRLGLASAVPRRHGPRCRPRHGRLAEDGLKRRARLDRDGDDERKALAPLIETIAEGRSPSDRLLAAYHGPWGGDIDKVFESQAF